MKNVYIIMDKGGAVLGASSEFQTALSKMISLSHELGENLRIRIERDLAGKED